MLLKLADMPKDTRLCKVLSADKIKMRSSYIDGLPGGVGGGGTLVDDNKKQEVLSSPHLQALVNACWRMVRACIHDNGIGLAAPQIGIMKRIFIIQENAVLDEEAAFKVYFHPTYTIDISSQPVIGPESCLSVPGKTLLITRASTICASWYEVDPDLGTIVPRTELLLEGNKARIFQHENDHLLGISILDRIK